MQNLVRVSRIDKLPQKLPFEKQTFYKWFHLKKHLEIFIKFSGALFVDLAALEQIMEKARHCHKEGKRQMITAKPVRRALNKPGPDTE